MLCSPFGGCRHDYWPFIFRDGDRFLDIGCGQGRPQLCLASTKRRSGQPSRNSGYDIAPECVSDALVCQAKCERKIPTIFSGCRRVKPRFWEGNALAFTDYGDYTHFYAFMGVNDELEDAITLAIAHTTAARMFVCITTHPKGLRELGLLAPDGTKDDGAFSRSGLSMPGGSGFTAWAFPLTAERKKRIIDSIWNDNNTRPGSEILACQNECGEVWLEEHWKNAGRGVKRACRS